MEVAAVGSVDLLMKNFLVTTPIQSTWPIGNEKMLFLGEWCTIYKSRNNLINRNFSVYPYHWDNRQKLYKDYQYLDNFYEKVLNELSAKLNSIHFVNKDIKYWRILIGPWLFYLIHILYDRWEMIQYAIEDGLASEVILLNRNIYEIIPSGMEDFNDQISTDDWNELIYGEIIRYRKFFNIHYVDSSIKPVLLKNKFTTQTVKRFIKIFIAIFANKISLTLGIKNTFFIISSSMGKFQEMILQIKLKQIPRFWISTSLEKYTVNEILRSSLFSSSNIDRESNFEDFFRMHVFKLIPTSYLEGYYSLVSGSMKMYSNEMPKIIYTTLSFQFNDKFKAWVADKILDGKVPFVIGQHGGNFGMSLWNANEDHQLKISNYFLSWGWRNLITKNVIPIGNLKLAGKNFSPLNRKKVLLLGLSIPRYSYHMLSAVVSAGQWEKYFRNQVDFVSNLDTEVQESLTIRLSNIDYGYSQEDRWMDLFPNIKMDYGNKSFYKELKTTKIFIGTYNSTSYLEAMAINIPTLLFWNPDHWECNETGTQCMKNLGEAGILYSDPIIAARKLNSIWGNIDEWWYSEEIQKTRADFCNTFSRTDKGLLNKLSSTLINISKQPFY